VSHTTIANYLSVLEETFVLHVLRPFNSHKSSEIVAAPKVYMFDTGFVCYYRGLYGVTPKEAGFLWEHYVLNELQARLQLRNICYWRDKQGHEIDFIIKRRGLPPVAIEAKWRNRDFDFNNMKVFKRQYPDAQVFVVTSDLTETKIEKFSGVSVKFIGLSGLLRYLCARGGGGLQGKDMG
jgi:hypothetical protein